MRMNPPHQRPPTIFEIFPSVTNNSSSNGNGTTATSPGLITCPREADILCGKDKTYSLHIGNRNYKQLIDGQGAKYAAAQTKQEKMDITRYIVSVLKQAGSRFLEPADDTTAATSAVVQPNPKTTVWKELSDSKARDKISHALRFYAKHHHIRKVSTDNDDPTPENNLAGIATAVESPTNATDGKTAPTKPFPPLTSIRPIPAPQPTLGNFFAEPMMTPYHNHGIYCYPPSVSSYSCSMLSNSTTNSSNFYKVHPLGLLGIAAEFLQSTSTPASSVCSGSGSSMSTARNSLATGGVLVGNGNSRMSSLYHSAAAAAAVDDISVRSSTTAMNYNHQQQNGGGESNTVRSMDSINYFDNNMNTIKSQEMRDIICQMKRRRSNTEDDNEDNNDDEEEDSDDHSEQVLAMAED